MGSTPLDMGPDVHGNLWLKKYRNNISLKVSDWDRFRDPDRVTYDSYVKMQDEQETYIDNLLISYTKDDSIDERFQAIASNFSPMHSHLADISFMPSKWSPPISSNLAPSSYVGNCAAFQVADQLRRVQRTAYRTKQLDNVHPAHGLGAASEGCGRSEPRTGSPIRKAMEQLLVIFAWDQAAIASSLAIRPICDDLFLNQLARAARASGDELDALILENLYRDSLRHNRWTVALAKFAIEEDPSNRAVLRGIAANWDGAGSEIVEAGSALVACHVPGLSASTIADDVRRNHALLHLEAGLGGDA